MKKLLKIVAILSLAAFITTAVVGIALAAVVVKDGFVTVAIEEHSPGGTRLTIPIPASLLNLALHFAPAIIPEEELVSMRRELAPYAPALRAAADALEDCPRARIVDVRSDSGTVQVVKGRKHFTVDVRGAEADVRVSIPADTLGRVLNAFGI